MVFSPVRLHQDAVDLFEADDLFAVADSFEQGGEAEVADAPQDALGGTPTAPHDGQRRRER